MEDQYKDMGVDGRIILKRLYWSEGMGSFPGMKKKFFSFPERLDRLWVPPRLQFQFNGYGGSFPGVNHPGYEADHSPPSSAEIKNGGAIPPLLHMSSMHSA
jgi:hypothetical protein